MMNYADYNYTEVFDLLGSGNASFDCEYPCKFLETLENDGYDEFLRTTSEDRVEKLKGGLTSDYCTGNIYVKSMDCYARVSVHKYQPSKYGVDIEMINGKSIKKSASDPFLKAMEKMSGQRSGPL